VFARRTPVVGAGRTDAGVHARGMVASFRTPSPMPAASLARALDAVLPGDVGVLAVRDAEPGVHALRDARWKWYRYSILRSRARRVFLRGTTWRVGSALDVGRMREAARLLEGVRDFAAFQSSGSPRRSTVRRVALRVVEEDAVLHLDAVGDGFLYGMVRALAGTLVEVGRGRRDASSVSDTLASGARSQAGPAAPPHGLCLMAVGYDGDARPVPV
jgi:tRNA pseudouridine38-40 synthase